MTERIPQTISEHIIVAGMAPWMFLLVVNVILLVAGKFMEPTGIITYSGAYFSHCHPAWLGHRRQHENRHGHAPGETESVRHQWHHWNEPDAGARIALPWLSVLLVFLMMTTYIPQISLWPQQLLPG